MSETTFRPFEAETGRVLDLVINSLYTNKDIFLRELISNAADACDKLRYESLSRPELLGDDSRLAVTLKPDAGAGTLAVTDNGVGMNREELIENLGTIARSGTARFAEALAERKGDVNLIGQFGVGFYSVFMVADRVTVLSRKAGEAQGWRWESDGKSGYSVEEQDGLPRGVTVLLHLREDAREVLSEPELARIVRTYSDHIAVPIELALPPKREETDEGTVLTPQEPKQLNEASALWTRPKAEIADEQYQEFYRHTAHAFDQPFATIHFQAEGVLSYTALLYVPGAAPFDLYDPTRKHGVKLYVRRVFIAESVEGLLPKYLRFLAGVVDSEDLALNVSRETLQHGAVVARMRRGLVSRVLNDLGKRADKDEEAYAAFWDEFGAVVKEGLYEDPDNHDKLLKLARFRSSKRDGWVSLAQYLEAMPEGQDAIYYLTGDNAAAMRASPQLEAARAKGVEALLLTDPVDEFWLPRVESFEGKKLVSLTRGRVDLSAIKGGEAEDEPQEPPAPEDDVAALIALCKAKLGEEVADVRASSRLTESAVCLVAPENGLDLRLERLLQQTQAMAALSKRVLEVNPKHDLIRRMAAAAKAGQDLDDLAKLLLDQARIVEGESLPDPAGFARRLNAVLARGLA